MHFFKRFNRKSISLSWFISYILIIAVATFINIYTYQSASDKVLGQINAINAEVLEKRRIKLDNLQKNIADLATELSRDEKVRSMMDETALSAKYLYDMIYVKKYISTWESIENEVERIYIYFKNTDYVVDSSIAQNSALYYKVRYKNKKITADEFVSILKEESTGKYVRIPDKDASAYEADLLYTFSIFSTDLFTPKATIVVELKNSTLLETNTKDAYIGDICILDKNNEVFITNYDENEEIEQIALNAMDKIGKDGVYIAKNKVVLCTKSIQNDWKYLSIVEKDEYLKELSPIRVVTVVMALVFIVLGISIAFYMTNKNKKPIMEIMKKLSKEQKEALEKQNVNELAYINSVIVDLLEKREEQNNKMKIQSLVVKDAVLNKLLNGENISEVSLSELLKSVGVTFDEKYFTVVMFYMDTSGLFFEENAENKDDDKLARLIISNVLGETLVGETVPVFCNLNDNFICIINSKNQNVSLEIKSALVKTMEFARTNFNLNFLAGQSGTHEGFDGLRQSYSEAVHIMEYKLFVKNDVIEYDTIKDSKASLYYFPIDKEIQMISALKSGNIDASLDILENIFDENLNQLRPQVQMVKCLVYDVLGSVLKVLNDTGEAGIDNILEHFQVFERIDRCETVIDIKNEFTDIFSEICTKSLAESIEKSKKIVVKIKEFIDAYYDDPNLSGALIAEHFKVNQSYLSTQFKKYAGEGLLEYITNVRMSKARNMLINTEETVEKISERVGYLNVRTFRRTFKKIYGVTPSTYRDT
ncbi:MAG: helix-turn-helix transcriptional regulator [Clostridia bacterium]|nr:helix-turn-helix transcriptional regulator [Clostridia bacterium]